MRRSALLTILIVAVFAYGLLLPGFWERRSFVRSSVPAGYTIPSKFSRILALGQKSLLADYLFLKTTTFIGGRGLSGKQMVEEDWQFIIGSLDAITDLDPYFVDPYMLAEGLLAWDAGMPDKANLVLLKGMEHRTKDWRLPFFVGFNHFYFLKNYQEASAYIMQASQLPGSPSYLTTLAARLAYYGGQSRTALLFLEEILAETSDQLLRRRLELRLTALKRAVTIEDALNQYRAREEKDPASLDLLVQSGDLAELPTDPYGGQWVIMKNGRVFSTSKFTLPKPSSSDNSARAKSEAAQPPAGE